MASYATSMQLSGSTVNNFFDQGNSEAMKTLSGWEAARCDEHQFRAKIKVSKVDAGIMSHLS